jgi:hypothetical protein
MEWKPFWKIGYFASLVMIVVYLLVGGLSYLNGHLRGMSAASWTGWFISVIAGGTLTGFIYAYAVVYCGKRASMDKKKES